MKCMVIRKADSDTEAGSSCFAVLTDSYGVHWSLNCEQTPEPRAA